MKAKVQELYPDFTKEVDNLPADQLKTRIVALQQGLSYTLECKEKDDELTAVKALATELGAPYREAIKQVKLKTSYLVELLKERS